MTRNISITTIYFWYVSICIISIICSISSFFTSTMSITTCTNYSNICFTPTSTTTWICTSWWSNIYLNSSISCTICTISCIIINRSRRLTWKISISTINFWYVSICIISIICSISSFFTSTMCIRTCSNYCNIISSPTSSTTRTSTSWWSNIYLNSSISRTSCTISSLVINCSRSLIRKISSSTINFWYVSIIIIRIICTIRSFFTSTSSIMTCSNNSNIIFSPTSTSTRISTSWRCIIKFYNLTSSVTWWILSFIFDTRS